MPDLKYVKKIVDNAKSGADKLDTIAKGADALAEKGKELSEIQSVLRGVSAFGKISSVLGITSVGISIVMEFVPGDSDETKILNGLSKIQEQIQDLGTSIEHQLNKLRQHIDITIAKTELGKATGKIDSINEDAKGLVKAKKNNKPVTTYTNKLLARNLNELTDATDVIVRYCVGDSITPNLFQLLYDHTYGDLRAIVEVGDFLLQHALTACILDATITALNNQKNQPGYQEADVSQWNDDIRDIYHDRLERISSAYHAAILNCIEWRNAKNNIKRFVERELFATQLNPWPGWSETPNRIIRQVSEQWYWYDFAAVVYTAVKGWNNHYNYSTDSLVLNWFRQNIGGATFNVILRWRIRPDNAKKEWHTKRDPGFAFAQRPTEEGIRQFVYDLTFDASIEKTDGPFVATIIPIEYLVRTDLRSSGKKYKENSDKPKHSSLILIWGGSFGDRFGGGRFGASIEFSSKMPIFVCLPKHSGEHGTGYYGIGINM